MRGREKASSSGRRPQDFWVPATEVNDHDNGCLGDPWAGPSSVADFLALQL